MSTFSNFVQQTKGARMTNEAVVSQTKMGGLIVGCLLHSVTQIHLFHAMVSARDDYGIHVKLGELYEDLTEDVDSILEKWLAMGNTFSNQTGLTLLVSGDLKIIEDYLTEMLDCVTDMIESSSDPELQALNAEFVDIQGDLLSTLYFFR